MNDKKQIRNRMAVVIVEQEKILLVQHEKYGRKYWLVPGGGVEFGESLAETGRRELLEETGLEVEIGDLLFIIESIPADGHRHVINYFYTGRLRGGELKLGEDDVLRDVQWHLIEDLPHLVMYPDVTRELREYLETGMIPQRSLGNRWA